MKTRTSFVSNSSSTSFLIKFPSKNEVTKYVKLFDIVIKSRKNKKNALFDYILLDKNQISDSSLIEYFQKLQESDNWYDSDFMKNVHEWDFDINRYLFIDFNKFIKKYIKCDEVQKIQLRKSIFNFCSEICMDDGDYISNDFTEFKYIKEFLTQNGIEYHQSEAFI